MSINIDIETNIIEAAATFNNIGAEVIGQAARVSINRALTAGRAQAAKTLSERVNRTQKVFRNKIRVTKAGTGRLHMLEGILSFDDTPQNLINFVVGNKNLIKLKGVKVKKRRKLKIHVMKGKKYQAPGLFIQKVRSKQVFYRSGKQFYKQSAPSAAEFIGRTRYRFPVQRRIQRTFNKNIKRQMEFMLTREYNKLRSTRLTRLKNLSKAKARGL